MIIAIFSLSLPIPREDRDPHQLVLMQDLPKRWGNFSKWKMEIWSSYIWKWKQLLGNSFISIRLFSLKRCMSACRLSRSIVRKWIMYLICSRNKLFLGLERKTLLERRQTCWIYKISRRQQVHKRTEITIFIDSKVTSQNKGRRLLQIVLLL